MRPPTVLVHEFVEVIPEVIREGTVYVCIPYTTVVHKCCCGCGHEVVTPLSPTDWKLIFDGVAISLHPSIGNWGLPCLSHYWLRQNRALWAGGWSQEEIDAGRSADALAKAKYYQEEPAKPDSYSPAPKPLPRVDAPATPLGSAPRPRQPWWRRLVAWLFGAS